MKCSKCNTELSVTSGFCPECGTRVGEFTGSQQRSMDNQQTFLTECRCQSCGATVSDTDEFCMECGSRLGASGRHCKRCGGELAPNGKFCPACGAALDEEQRDKRIITKLILGAVVLACILFGAYSLIHVYQPATCTQAKICGICGKQEGIALGHDYAPATCTTPKICKRCGIQSGSALAHDYAPATCTVPKTCRDCGRQEGKALTHTWKAATLYQPKTCSACKETEGNSLARSLSADELSYSFATTGTKHTIKNGGILTDYPGVFKTPIQDCVRLTINLKVTEALEGNVEGEWGFWVKIDGEKWQLLKKFTYDGTPVKLTYDFDEPISFDQYSIGLRESKEKFSYQADRYLSDVWVMR